MPNNKDSATSSTLLIFLCLFYSSFASLYSVALNRIALYAALPLAFVLAVFKNRSKKISDYLIVLIIIYLIELLSCTWAVDLDVALAHMHTDIGCVLLSIIVYVLARESENIPWLYLVYISWYLFAWLYALTHNLVLLDVSDEYSRMNNSKLNANTMAYFTFYMTFAIFVLSEIVKNHKLSKFLRVLFGGMIPLSFFVALFTASRQVLVIQIPLIAMLLYVRYFQKTTFNRKFMLFLVSLIVFVVFFNRVSSVYESSYLRQRSETNIMEDDRILLLKDAFNVGMNHFFTGVGAGNYTVVSYNKHFSHNTYIELFACTGIFNALLYIWLVLHFIFQQRRRYLRTKDKHFLGFLVFGIIFAVDNFFYVFHIDCWLISFFILVYTHSDTYYKKLLSNEQPLPIYR